MRSNAGSLRSIKLATSRQTNQEKKKEKIQIIDIRSERGHITTDSTDTKR